MTIAFPFQEEDATKATTEFSGRCLIAHDMGLGKTFTGMLTAHKLHANPIVVVCPASIKFVWEEQAKRHFGLSSVVLSGMNPKKELLQNPSPVIIINYDILKKWIPLLKDLNPKMVILDECHYCQSYTSIRTRQCRRLCQGVNYVVALSGTPLINRPKDLWPTLNILRPDLFPNFFSYGHRYCGAWKAPWGWTYNGATHVKELHQLLEKNLMLRRRKIDVLSSLPPKQRIVVPLEIRHRAIYNQAINDFRSWLKQNMPGKLRGKSKAEGLVKLGYLRRLVAKLKMKAVCEWIDNFLSSSDNKLIVFAIHKKVIAKLMEKYGKIAVKIDGSVSLEDRKTAIKKFLNTKKCRLFFGNIKAAGVGWSAKGVSDIMFTEFPWSPAEIEQCIDRGHGLDRGKESCPTVAWFLVARDTIEERLCEILQEKAKTISSVLDGKKVNGVLDILNLLIKSLKNAD